MSKKLNLNLNDVLKTPIAAQLPLFIPHASHSSSYENYVRYVVKLFAFKKSEIFSELSFQLITEPE
jgi:peptidase E